ncbi:MAG: amidophosphoribosyltransferase [Bacteroidetes bacterium]|nr:amidophosphoribosyltransferase [Bacteroidota bacterium]
MESFTITSEDQWYGVPSHREEFFRNLIGERRRGRVANTGFFVNDSDEIRLIGTFLKQDTNAFYNADYNSGSSWQIPNSIENLIWTFKNDVDPFPERLPNVQQQLSAILRQDLPQIIRQIGKNNLTVCVVPRSKAEGYYRADQLFFRRVISNVADELPNFQNGTNYIVRHTNTRTTHLDRNGEGGDGNLPYPGITKNTCTISEQVNGKNILLIDDLYTKSVNIDEDAIQALLDNGANSVTFYSIGKTVSRN